MVSSYRLLCYYLNIERLRQTLNHKCTIEHMLILKVHLLRDVLACDTFDRVSKAAYCFVKVGSAASESKSSVPSSDVFF
jgi:hypothetical protein